MRVSRGIAVLSFTAVAVLGLTACSSDDKADTGSSTSAQDTTSDKGSESKAESADFTPEDFASRLTVAATKAGSVSMTMDTEAPGQSMSAKGDVRFLKDTQEMRMVTQVPEAGEVEMLLIDGMIYMNMADLTQGKYIQIDPNDASNPLAATFAPMMSQLDPKSSISNLEGAIVSVEKNGEPEQVDGVDAQPYTVVVDGAKAAAAAGAGAAASAAPAEITYQYWVDADDLMRKIVIDQAGAKVEMTFSNWGEDFELTAPTADQLTEMPF